MVFVSKDGIRLTPADRELMLEIVENKIVQVKAEMEIYQKEMVKVSQYPVIHWDYAVYIDELKKYVAKAEMKIKVLNELKQDIQL